MIPYTYRVWVLGAGWPRARLLTPWPIRRPIRGPIRGPPGVPRRLSGGQVSTRGAVDTVPRGAPGVSTQGDGMADGYVFMTGGSAAAAAAAVGKGPRCLQRIRHMVYSARWRDGAGGNVASGDGRYWD